MKLTKHVVRKDYITPKDALHSMISNHLFIFQFGQLPRDLMELTNSVVGQDYVTPKDVLHGMISDHMLIFQFRQLSPGPDEADQQCCREGLHHS